MSLLEEKLKTLPNSPGVYLMKNSDGKIMHHKELEVGTLISDKDTSLKDVVKSFQSSDKERSLIEYKYNGIQKNLCYIKFDIL